MTGMPRYRLPVFLTRGDCVSAPRPCPLVSCRHHLLIHKANKNGSLQLNRVTSDTEYLDDHINDRDDTYWTDADVERALRSMPHTCSLDAAIVGTRAKFNGTVDSLRDLLAQEGCTRGSMVVTKGRRGEVMAEFFGFDRSGVERLRVPLNLQDDDDAEPAQPAPPQPTQTDLPGIA